MDRCIPNIFAASPGEYLPVGDTCGSVFVIGILFLVFVPPLHRSVGSVGLKKMTKYFYYVPTTGGGCGNVHLHTPISRKNRTDPRPVCLLISEDYFRSSLFLLYTSHGALAVPVARLVT